MNVGASSNIHQSITSFFFSWFGSAGEGGWEGEGSRKRERCLGFVHFFPGCKTA